MFENRGASNSGRKSLTMRHSQLIRACWVKRYKRTGRKFVLKPNHISCPLLTSKTATNRLCGIHILNYYFTRIISCETLDVKVGHKWISRSVKKCLCPALCPVMVVRPVTDSVFKASASNLACFSFNVAAYGACFKP